MQARQALATSWVRGVQFSGCSNKACRLPPSSTHHSFSHTKIQTQTQTHLSICSQSSACHHCHHPFPNVVVFISFHCFRRSSTPPYIFASVLQTLSCGAAHKYCSHRNTFLTDSVALRFLPICVHPSTANSAILSIVVPYLS